MEPPRFPVTPVHVFFEEFSQLPLTNIRRFHLDTEGWEPVHWPRSGPRVFHHLSSFHTLEAFTIGHEADLSFLLSPLLSNPSAFPSLKTLAFLNCDLSEDFTEELGRLLPIARAPLRPGYVGSSSSTEMESSLALVQFIN